MKKIVIVSREGYPALLISSLKYLFPECEIKVVSADPADTREGAGMMRRE